MLLFLWAEPGAVYRLILGEPAWLTARGIVLGLGGSLGVGVLMRGVLFGVNSWEYPHWPRPLAYSALRRCWPAISPRRAASVNPVDALRAE
jgi:hypothetical protein